MEQEITYFQVRIRYKDGQYEWCWLPEEYAVEGNEIILDKFIRKDATVIDVLIDNWVVGTERSLRNCIRIKHPLPPMLLYSQPGCN